MRRFETFSMLITKINRNMRKLKSQEMRQFNLRSSHVHYIYYLYKEKALSLKQLSEICVSDKAAVSRGIDELQELGYVKQSGKRQYKLSFSLTEEGEKIGERLALKVDSVLEATSIGISEEKRLEFYNNLSKISENLQRLVDDNLEL